MIALLAQAAPGASGAVAVELPASFGALLVAAVAALAGALAFVGRWLLHQIEAQAARFTDALAQQQVACAGELREVTAAFRADCEEDRVERQRDREARHAIAERTAEALSGIQAELLRGARLEPRPAARNTESGGYLAVQPSED